jgi:hypothetical protein
VRRSTWWLAAAVGLFGCATGTFRISAAAQLKAEEAANLDDMSRAAAEGLQGTWLTTNWRGGLCRWSPEDRTVAVCQTATRRSDSQPWRPTVQRYRRDDQGAWELLP